MNRTTVVEDRETWVSPVSDLELARPLNHGSKQRRGVGAAMPPTCYPIALVLDGKRCLVVGGGEIADGKLDALLLAGAVVTVVSPEVRPRIAALAAEGQI